VSEPVVRVAGLTKEFRTYRRHEGLAAALKSLVRRVTTEAAAVADVTFSVEPGEMAGYIGANGAGKSTTIKMLTGILTPTSGEIVCNGFVPYRDRTRYVATIGVERQTGAGPERADLQRPARAGDRVAPIRGRGGPPRALRRVGGQGDRQPLRRRRPLDPGAPDRRGGEADLSGGDRVGELPLRRRDDFQETSVE
jgi:hypothetical protein